MKRYLVFAYYGYYPSGGWDDFQDAFDSLLDAKHYAYELVNFIGEVRPRFEYAQVVDLESGKITEKLS